MKERSIFNESFSEEVSSVSFSKKIPTHLLGGSLEGIISLFDLTQNDEENSTDLVVRLDQPIEKCDFIDNSTTLAYAITSVQ